MKHKFLLLILLLSNFAYAQPAYCPKVIDCTEKDKDCVIYESYNYWDLKTFSGYHKNGGIYVVIQAWGASGAVTPDRGACFYYDGVETVKMKSKVDMHASSGNGWVKRDSLGGYFCNTYNGNSQFCPFFME